jgi:hypothetical protein
VLEASRAAVGSQELARLSRSIRTTANLIILWRSKTHSKIGKPYKTPLGKPTTDDFDTLKFTVALRAAFGPTRRLVAALDGRPLRIRRFDDYWISAERDDIQYEFNRGDGTLTYAGSMVEGITSTTVVGSGRCVPHGAPSL